ncbi:MAG: filamentous hemagglutinin N-terminal domain-containing protein [Noviherbaspirillum sp.]
MAPVNGNAAAAFTAPNGVPVVNINNANGAGLSHNQYQRYDVDRHGLVLNNSLLPGQSQLAGALKGNPNLSREAALILNEVVSANHSTLAGFTEVLGGRADVIVANPYGNTCCGCGFINSDRVTLTTGAPAFGADGSLAGFNVSRGDVLINGGGLNASAQQILDIVTRSARVDGQINTAAGGSLGIAAGNNAWSYASREVTGSSTPDGAAPFRAIDSSALGGMYAGRIRLIATEAGVGVRMLGDAAASVDDFRLDAAGRVQMAGRVSAARDLRIAQSGDADAAALEVAGAGLAVLGARAGPARAGRHEPRGRPGQGRHGPVAAGAKPERLLRRQRQPQRRRRGRGKDRRDGRHRRQQLERGQHAGPACGLAHCGRRRQQLLQRRGSRRGGARHAHFNRRRHLAGPRQAAQRHRHGIERAGRGARHRRRGRCAVGRQHGAGGKDRARQCGPAAVGAPDEYRRHRRRRHAGGE